MKATTQTTLGELGSGQWAQAEFGHTALGHSARTKRIVAMSQRMLERPSGRVTKMFDTGAQRDAAYRALENPAIEAQAIGQASTHAAVLRTIGHQLVYIPIDGTSLSFNLSPATDLGDVGNKKSRSKGVQVQNTIIVGEDGHTLGVAHQHYWRRKRKPKLSTREERRKLGLKDKETRYWLECIEKTEAAFLAAQVDTERWYLLDRGGDFRELLLLAAQADHGMVIRSSWNRRVAPEGLSTKEKHYLKEQADHAPILGHFALDVTAGPNRTARRAIMEVRSRRYTFRLENRCTRELDERVLTVVWTQEVSEVPEGEKALQWRLLTNTQVEDFWQAAHVVYAYSRRWRIEEMHRCWKTVCEVEQTRLRNYSSLLKFATIMASVAARIEHLKTASREKPDAPAHELFSLIELDAIRLLRFKQGPAPSEEPTAWEAVCWVATLGGYLGPRNGPPGSQTIARGLERVLGAVDVLESIGWEPGSPPDRPG
jgi:hypothetical protein